MHVPVAGWGASRGNQARVHRRSHVQPALGTDVATRPTRASADITCGNVISVAARMAWPILREPDPTRDRTARRLWLAVLVQRAMRRAGSSRADLVRGTQRLMSVP